MIVSSMTLSEIQQEIINDLECLRIKTPYQIKEFRRKVLQATKFPYQRTYTINSKRNNKFYIMLTATKRSQHHQPELTIYTIYNRQEGNYAVSLSSDFKTITVLPPHFFKRLRERILPDSELSNTALIQAYFKKVTALFLQSVTLAQIGIYKDVEPAYITENLSFVGVNDWGYIFGEKIGDIFLVKTIVSASMLYPQQLIHFQQMNANMEAHNLMYRRTP